MSDEPTEVVAIEFTIRSSWRVPKGLGESTAEAILGAHRQRVDCMMALGVDEHQGRLVTLVAVDVLASRYIVKEEEPDPGEEKL